MAVGATFEDSRGTDFLGQQQSMMERAQAMRLREQSMALQREQAQQQKAEFIAKMPALIAKREADIVTAKASIANSVRMEQLRAKAATDALDYNDRFLNIMSMPDLNDRADTLAAFQAEVGWLENPGLPEYHGFVKAVDDAQAMTSTKALALGKLQEARDVMAANLAAKKLAAEKSAQTAIEVAQIRANAPVAIQKLTDAYAAAKEAGADEEILNSLRSAMEKTATRSEQASAVERAIANRDAALAAGDRAKAQVFQDEINKATSFASDPIKNPLPASSTKASTSEQPYKEIKLQSGGVIKIREKAAK